MIRPSSETGLVGGKTTALSCNSFSTKSIISVLGVRGIVLASSTVKTSVVNGTSEKKKAKLKY